MAEGKTLAEYGITNAYTKDEVDALIPVFPTVVSAFINDSGYLTEHQDISGKQDKLTSNQMAAAKSGITAEKVSLYDTYRSIIEQKQDKLTSAQLTAARSGVTADKIFKYNTYESLIVNKADKGTTLADYGITDTYNKTDVEDMFTRLKDIIEAELED